MSTQFADPDAAGGPALDYQQLRNHLLIISVLGFEEHIPTVYTQPGEKSPAVRANITVVDGPDAGTTFENTLVFAKVLVSQLRTRVGLTVLGRLTMGNAKPGQNAPWRLDPADDSDRQKAEAILTKVRGGGPQEEPPF